MVVCHFFLPFLYSPANPVIPTVGRNLHVCPSCAGCRIVMESIFPIKLLEFHWGFCRRPQLESRLCSTSVHWQCYAL